MYESKNHIIMIIVFCLGRYFLLSGGKEIAILKWNSIEFKVYKSGPNIGKNYTELTIDADKTNYMHLKRPTIS